MLNYITFYIHFNILVHTKENLFETVSNMYIYAHTHTCYNAMQLFHTLSTSFIHEVIDLDIFFLGIIIIVQQCLNISVSESLKGLDQLNGMFVSIAYFEKIEM